MGFTRCFRIEVKEFQVSMSDGGLVKLFERSHKSHSSITLGRFSVLWLSNMVNKLLVANAERSFVLKFNEASHVFLA